MSRNLLAPQPPLGACRLSAASPFGRIGCHLISRLAAACRPEHPRQPSARGAARELEQLDEPDFDAETYLKRLLKETRLAELADKHKEMVTEVGSLDSDMQMLVYENYNKFIAATDTIKLMNSSMEGMDERTLQLQRLIGAARCCAASLCTQRLLLGSLTCRSARAALPPGSEGAVEMSSQVKRKLEARQEHIEELNRTRLLLHKLQACRRRLLHRRRRRRRCCCSPVPQIRPQRPADTVPCPAPAPQSVFDLPRALRVAIDSQAYEVAADRYHEAAPLLDKYGHKVGGPAWLGIRGCVAGMQPSSSDLGPLSRRYAGSAAPRCSNVLVCAWCRLAGCVQARERRGDRLPAGAGGHAQAEVAGAARRGGRVHPADREAWRGHREPAGARRACGARVAWAPCCQRHLRS